MFNPNIHTSLMNRFVQLFNAPSLDFWFPLLKETKFQNHRYTFQRARASSRSKNVTKSEETVPKLNISTELRILANRWTFRNSQVSELLEVSGNEAGSWSSLEKQENQRRRSSFWTNLTFQTERRLEIPSFWNVSGSMRKRTRRLRGEAGRTEGEEKTRETPPINFSGNWNARDHLHAYELQHLWPRWSDKLPAGRWSIVMSRPRSVQ